MRFYTLEWWTGTQGGEPPDPKSLFDAYDAHLREIEARVPQGLVALVRRGPLHDGKLRSWRMDVERRTFVVELTAYEVNGEHVSITMSYGAVRSVMSIADPKVGLMGPYGYGDIGYTEIHLVDGVPEHWILFSSGIEVRVSFESFEERTTSLDRKGAG